jgi:cell wall integrity and stress response component
LDPASVTGTAGGTTKTSTTSGGASTVVVTAAPSSNSKSGGGKSSTVGIAVGVVVGIIAIGGLVFGVWFFLRHKRRRDAEEEYKRQAAVSQFVNGGKSHNSNGSMNDSRLEPDILQRRESTGSIADNQDYSRRILKVCSPIKPARGLNTNNAKVRNPDDF